MTITPRITVSAIEFVRSKDGSDDKEVVCVPLDVIRYVMELGAIHTFKSHEIEESDDRVFTSDTVLTILRQEAEK